MLVNGPLIHYVSKDTKAGTQLPVTKIRNHMKRIRQFYNEKRRDPKNPVPSPVRGSKKYSVSLGAGVYLTGILESFIKRLITLTDEDRGGITLEKIASVIATGRMIVPPNIAILLSPDFTQTFSRENAMQNYKTRIRRICAGLNITLPPPKCREYLNRILNMMLILHVLKAHHYNHKGGVQDAFILKSKHIHRASEDIFHVPVTVDYNSLTDKHVESGQLALTKFRGFDA